MAKQTPPDITKLVRRHLLALARERNDDFNVVMIRYGLERLLYRLSCSEHHPSFVLKGAMLFSVWGEGGYRATKDLDLLAYGSSDVQRLERVFRDVCTQRVEPDGMTFNPDSIELSQIREETDYGGMRIALHSHFGSDVNMRLQVDIGFGDAVVPAPQEVEYPTLSHSLVPPPRVRVYPREVVVAEKLQAMVHLGMANSRMKDFFDLNFLCEHFPFIGLSLSASIQATFARRGTTIPSNTPLALTALFAADPLKRSQWQGFLRRSRLSHDLALAHVVEQLERFLMPPLNAISRGEMFRLQWRPGNVGSWMEIQ